MVTYTVHERETETGDISERAEKIVFVRWGFAWTALPIPFLWLLYHRMWLVLAAYTALIVSIQAGLKTLGSGQEEIGWAMLVVNSVFALLANDLRRWTLGLKGYHMVEMVRGKNILKCEERFFTDWLEEQEAREDRAGETAIPAPRSQHSQYPGAAPITPPSGSTEADGVIGLFPEPGK